MTRDDPGESPRIAVAIQHVEARAHLLPRLRAALGDGWYSLDVVTGDAAARNPWETYRDCLVCALPAVLVPTHLLVIQDDALPVADFYERAASFVAERPRDLLCLYVPALPNYMGRAMLVAQQAGERFAPLPGGMFTPLVAAVWPVELAAACLAWYDVTPSSHSRRCDDAQVVRFLRARRKRAWGTVPSLADHDEETPSTLGLGRYRRHAALLPA